LGKLSALASVSSSKAASFVYVPPPAAFGATRILVKPQLGSAPAVSRRVLDKVLRGLRRANPHARIVLIDGAMSDSGMEAIYQHYGLYDLLDDNMRAGDAENLIMAAYDNLLENPAKYASMTAPATIREYDCCISVAAFTRTTLHDEVLASASLHNLFGLFPRSQYSDGNELNRNQLYKPRVDDVLRDVYFTIGHYFHGAVVGISEANSGDEGSSGQVVWGNDLLAVDAVACRIAGEPTASYIDPIRTLRKRLEQASD
jgi:hypothetical protein